MRRVLVTGGTGFIGSHLVERLLEKGVFVRCLVRESNNLGWLKKDGNIEYVVGNVLDYNSLIPAVSQIDTVFHLAGLTKSTNEEDFYRVNAEGTSNLLKAVVEVNPHLRRFVYISSQAVTGPSSTPVTEFESPKPVTSYGASKLAGEKRVLAFGSQIPVTILRPAIVYGPRERDVYTFFRMIKWGIKPVLGWEEHYGSFIYVDDLIDGIILAAENKKAIGQIYFLVSESIVSWSDLNNEIARALGKKAVTIRVPVLIASFIAVVTELISKLIGKPSILTRQKIKELREKAWICDGSKAERELDFHPKVLLPEGIDRCVDWYKKQGWL